MRPSVMNSAMLISAGIQERDAQCDALRDQWKKLLTDKQVPTHREFSDWIDQCGATHVFYAIGQTARTASRSQMTSKHMLNYAAKIVRRLAQ